MPLTASTQRNFAADFFPEKYPLRGKHGQSAFLCTLLGDLGTTYADHLRLIGKLVVDFLLVIIELFLLGVTDEMLRASTDSKSASFKVVRQFGPIFQVEEDLPHLPFVHE